MSQADTAEFQLAKLADKLNNLRAGKISAATMNPGNEMAVQMKHEAAGYLRALDDIAHIMGLTTETVYQFK